VSAFGDIYECTSACYINVICAYMIHVRMSIITITCINLCVCECFGRQSLVNNMLASINIEMSGHNCVYVLLCFCPMRTSATKYCRPTRVILNAIVYYILCSKSNCALFLCLIWGNFARPQNFSFSTHIENFYII